MKKLTALFLALLMALSLVACGTGTPTTPPVHKYDSFEEIENAMSTEASSTGTAIADSLSKLMEKIGDSYDGYTQNLSAIDAWYADCQTEAAALYTKLTQLATDYYKMIVSTLGIDDYKSWDRAMEDCYDAWDDSMEDFYDKWDDSFEDIYDLLDDIISDAYDSVSYNEASDAWSDMYHKHSDAWSSMYHQHSDAWSNLYNTHSDVWSGFYKGNSDVDALIAAAKDSKQAEAEKNEEKVKDSEKEKAKNEDTKPTESTSTDTNKATDSNGVSPELKEALDSYEAFIDEYIEFMDTYSDSDDPLSMLSSYTDYMQKYTDMAKKMDEIDEDSLSDADYQYYLEVQTRVSGKLLDAAY